ncbi:MAG: matrixin family metalloprotease [Blastocatellia bacterium]
MRLGRRSIACILIYAAVSMAAPNGFASFSAESERQPLKWRAKQIKVAVSATLLAANTNIKTGSDVEGAIKRSLGSWEAVADIEFQATKTTLSSVSPAGSNGDGVSLITVGQTAENVAFFSKDPFLAPAATRVFYNRRGAITEADIVLNPFEQFSTDGTFGTYDLEAVLTHEIGHLLGLDHSPSLGATMHSNVGRNGLFSLPAYSSRTLSKDDIGAVRSKYGIADADIDCCAVINGKLLLPNGRAARGAVIWAENEETGSVEESAVTGADGRFKLNGIESGKLRLYARTADDGRLSVATLDLGEISVEADDLKSIARRFPVVKSGPKIDLIGFNGQLSSTVISLNSGKSYRLYLGGDFEPDSVTIGFTSKYFSIVPETISKQDFGKESNVISFEVEVDPKAPRGEYTIFVESDSGVRSYLVGGVTIEDHSNPFSIFNIPSE